MQSVGLQGAGLHAYMNLSGGHCEAGFDFSVGSAHPTECAKPFLPSRTYPAQNQGCSSYALLRFAHVFVPDPLVQQDN